VDYLTIHIWPKNWRWISGVHPDVAQQMAKENPSLYGAPPESGGASQPAPGVADMSNVAVQVGKAIEKTKDYIDSHTAIAEKLRKPLVIEEFGYPRDNHRYDLQDPVTGRDSYYGYIFSRVKASRDAAGLLAGCNFWAWGGFGRPAHLFWLPWDDYLGDPSQEEQGLNAVFDTDSTIDVIKAQQLTN
jgi:mannan endo-1,4-beta-mannosidase